MNSHPCGQTLGEILYSNWLTLVIFFNFFSIINFYRALISYYQQKTLEKLKTFEKSEKLSLPIFYAIRVSGIWF